MKFLLQRTKMGHSPPPQARDKQRRAKDQHTMAGTEKKQQYKLFQAVMKRVSEQERKVNESESGV
jgi:hypothetical protein